MAAHACHPKRFGFWNWFEKRNVFKQKFYFRFANVFSIKTFSFLKKMYFRFGNTHSCVQIKIFRFKNKNNFTFVSQMFSKQEHFPLKKIIFVSETLTFVAETLRKTNRKKSHHFVVVARAGFNRCEAPG